MLLEVIDCLGDPVSAEDEHFVNLHVNFVIAISCAKVNLHLAKQLQRFLDHAFGSLVDNMFGKYQSVDADELIATEIDMSIKDGGALANLRKHEACTNMFKDYKLANSLMSTELLIRILDLQGPLTCSSEVTRDRFSKCARLVGSPDATLDS